MKHKHVPWVVYGLVALAIMAPLLKQGYIFALDMVFGPRIHLPQEVSSSYPFYILLWLINFVVSSQVIQKVLLLGIVVMSGIGAHWLTQYLISRSGKSSKGQILWGSYFAGLLYIINPFTYDRFMDGQYAVLMGYALLPFFVMRLFKLVFDKQINIRSVLYLATLIIGLSIVSIHAVGYVVVLLSAALVIAGVRYRHDTNTLRQLGKAVTLCLIIVLVVSSFWLIPALLGKTSRTATINEFDERHLLTFRTDGSNGLKVIGNSAALQGYWGEREGRFRTVKDVSPLWPVFIGMIIILATYGFYKSWKLPQSKVLFLGMVLALILAVGITVRPFSYLNRLMVDYLPYFRGFREPQKFVSIIALGYAIFGGIGLTYLLNAKPIQQRYELWLAVPLLLVPYAYTPTMVWAFGNQLQSRHYPADWYEVDTNYIHTATGSTLFLPWHEYMYFDFAGRVIANPAHQFFGGKTFTGDNAEIGLIKRQSSSVASDTVERLLSGPGLTDFGAKIMPLHVQYVLLGKTADWRDYSFLDHQIDLKLISDTQSLKLYRNLAYRQEGM